MLTLVWQMLLSMKLFPWALKVDFKQWDPLQGWELFKENDVVLSQLLSSGSCHS